MAGLMGHLIWNQRCIILSSRKVTDCKLTAVWLEIEVDSAGRETAGLGLAQVGQHTQEKKKKLLSHVYCQMVTIVMMEMGIWWSLH